MALPQVAIPCCATYGASSLLHIVWSTQRMRTRAAVFALAVLLSVMVFQDPSAHDRLLSFATASHARLIVLSWLLVGCLAVVLADYDGLSYQYKECVLVPLQCSVISAFDVVAVLCCGQDALSSVQAAVKVTSQPQHACLQNQCNDMECPSVLLALDAVCGYVSAAAMLLVRYVCL